MKLYAILCSAIIYKSIYCQFLSNAPACVAVLKNDIGTGVCFNSTVCQFFRNLLPQGNCTLNECCFAGNFKPIQCGKKGDGILKGQSRIIGGTSAKENEVCWQVAIVERNTKMFIGGGTLIRPQWVLTTASVVKWFLNTNLQVRVGSNNLNFPSHCEKTSLVQEIIMHPGYTEDPYFYNNIALLRLVSPIDITSNCSCILCLPDKATTITPTTDCEISGYGSTTVPGGFGPNFLRVSAINTKDSTTCISTLAARLNDSTFTLDQSSLCAQKTATDTCTGDGGGPLYCQPDPSKSQFILVGLTSWGVGCGEPNMPAVYTNIANFLDWILKQI